MADGGIQRSTFIIKHDGSIDFSINQKISVQEPGKVSVFSRQEKLYSQTGDRTRVSRLQVWRANHQTTEIVKKKKC